MAFFASSWQTRAPRNRSPLTNTAFPPIFILCTSLVREISVKSFVEGKLRALEAGSIEEECSFFDGVTYLSRGTLTLGMFVIRRYTNRTRDAIPANLFRYLR